MNQPIDRGTLQALIADMSPGGETIVHGLFQVLCKNFPETLERIRGALEADDLEQVREAAHRAKSGCGTLGALRLAELCAATEKAAKEQQAPEIEDLLVEMNEEWAVVETASRKLMAFLSGGGG